MTRFNSDANTINDAKEYLVNRSKQLLVDDIILCGIEDESFHKMSGVVTAIFQCTKSLDLYVGHYVLKQNRGKGKYEKAVKRFNLPIVTSPSCNLARFLQIKKIPYRLAAQFQYWDEYQMIQNVYSNTRAQRSGLYYMNHIDEGLAILKKIKANDSAQRAFCLHPVVQLDSIYKEYANIQITKSPTVMSFAVEYRNVANAYLSPMGPRKVKDIVLSPIKEVNDMLIADKIQNRKDFELHRTKYSNANDLYYYFRNWLERLGVEESFYQEMKEFLLTA